MSPPPPPPPPTTTKYYYYYYYYYPPAALYPSQYSNTPHMRAVTVHAWGKTNLM